MLRSCLTALLLFTTFITRAQTGHLHVPVRLTDGRPIAVFGAEEGLARTQLREAKIRFIHVRKLSQKTGGSIDTYTVESRPFTPFGDPQPYDEHRKDFNGENHVVYDSRGRMLQEDWMYDEIAGCSNARWMVHHRSRKTYEYENGRLVMIRSGSTGNLAQHSDTTVHFHEFDAWRYDRKGRVKLRTRFNISPGTTDTSSLGDAVMFRYDRKGRPLHALIADEDSLRNEGLRSYRRVDSLLALIPDDFSTIQLRRSEWGDSLRFREYGDPDTMHEDADERMRSETATQDSMDELRSAFFDAYSGRYGSLLKGYIGYQYDEKGRLSGRIHVDDEGLARKDSFNFDENGRLARWIIWTPGAQYTHYNPWMEAVEWSYGTWTSRTYEYDRHDRVSRLLEIAYSNERYDRQKLHPVWERCLALEYNAAGLVVGIGSDFRKYQYGYNGSDTEARIERDSSRFVIGYERYGRAPKSFREPGVMPAK